MILSLVSEGQKHRKVGVIPWHEHRLLYFLFLKGKIAKVERALDGVRNPGF